MTVHPQDPLTARPEDRRNHCLSCGTSENMKRRRYCSVECRQRLRRHLNLRTGLLKALNTKYATFYFTESMIVLDVLPFGSAQLFSFIFPRSRRKKPVEDFSTLANLLGNAWWAERRRTNRRYLATRHVLAQARSNNSGQASLKPFEVKKPARLAKTLTFFRLSHADLDSPRLRQIIKSVYRRQAKIYHPDRGGDAAVFRKLHEAYEQLIGWSENPTYTQHRGFPDKWFYDGHTNRWRQPTPERPKP